jgi:glycosyltransferase involved in cell wall biosynthesis
MAGTLCYDAADPIIALYEANRLRQVPTARRRAHRNIPNGIDLPASHPLRALRPAEVPPPVLCLIGRVVPIKDIKTFIRAMRRVANRLPEAEGWIAGPEDEDPAYAEECRTWCQPGPGRQGEVPRFPEGRRPAAEDRPDHGCSSISEALPLVILEGYAAGVPTVSTDVGSCRQLVEGLDEDDRRWAPPARWSTSPTRRRWPTPPSPAGRRRRPGGREPAGIARVERYYTDRRCSAAIAGL